MGNNGYGGDPFAFVSKTFFSFDRVTYNLMIARMSYQ